MSFDFKKFLLQVASLIELFSSGRQEKNGFELVPVNLNLKLKEKLKKLTKSCSSLMVAMDNLLIATSSASSLACTSLGTHPANFSFNC